MDGSFVGETHGNSGVLALQENEYLGRLQLL